MERGRQKRGLDEVIEHQLVTMYHDVCKTNELPEGKSRMFAIAGTIIGLFHVNGAFFAIENECPHAGASLAHGYIDGENVSCRIHHWQFCLRNGQYLGDEGPEHDRRVYHVRVQGDQVQVEV